jgi:hypothetical protein
LSRQIPRDAFDSIPPQELQKGKAERLVIQPWVRNGFAYLSLGIQDQQEDGSYAFMRKKGFALSVREAKEFVLKLAAQVCAVEAQMARVFDEEGGSVGEGS